MQDDQNNQIETVAKPGESEAEQFDVDAIPEADITYDDLEQGGENPEGWLMYGNNYRRHHHTSAEGISPDNVSNLQREWEMTEWKDVQEGVGGQGSPLVVPGDPPIMYMTIAPQRVNALNARTGELLWRYEYFPKSGVVAEEPSASRGVAVLGDTVYYSTLDFGMVALDRYTADEKWYYNGAYEYRGESVEDLQWEAWETGNDPNTAMHPEIAYETDRGSSSAFPPLVHDGVILKGSFGGEMGVAGWAEGIPTEERAAEMETATPGTPDGTPVGNATMENATGDNETMGEMAQEANATAENDTATPGENVTMETETETPEPQQATPDNETATAVATETPEAAEQQPAGPGDQTGAEPVSGDHNTPVWHLNMTPPDDWIGESWKHGGSTVWQAGALDLETGRAVLPTANPGPWFGTVRPGWNPFSAGKVAIDFHTGDFQWNYQEVPHDWWDYDSPSPALIFDAEVRGEERTLASWPGKTPWVFTMDLETGQLVTRSDPFVETLNMWDLPVRQEEGVEAAEWVMPHLIGGTDPQPSSYDPDRQTMIVKGSNQPMKLLWQNIEYKVAQSYTGMDVITGAVEQRDNIDGWNQPVGNLTALDPATGEIKWQNWYENLLWGGVLTTTTGVTFAGIADMTFRAYDTESGEELWQDELGAGVDGNPISWVDPNEGKQYVAVKAGGSRGGGGFELVTYSMDMDGGGDD